MLFFLHQGYRVIAHDRRGHGRSAQPSEGNDFDHYATTWPTWSSTWTCTTPSTSGTPQAARRSVASAVVVGLLGVQRDF
jgi:non-heme chloroperoxidase